MSYADVNDASPLWAKILTDDQIVALLGVVVGRAADLQQAMSTAASKGDHTAVRVVATWLDLASRLGRSPSSREVAKEAYVSDTAVRQCLARFTELLSKVAAPSVVTSVVSSGDERSSR